MNERAKSLCACVVCLKGALIRVFRASDHLWLKLLFWPRGLLSSISEDPPLPDGALRTRRHLPYSGEVGSAGVTA